MKTCPNCSKEIEDRSKFCSYCGVNIENFVKSLLNKIYTSIITLLIIVIGIVFFHFIAKTNELYNEAMTAIYNEEWEVAKPKLEKLGIIKDSKSLLEYVNYQIEKSEKLLEK